MKLSTKTLAAISVLIALEIVLSRFLSIATPIMKVGLAFVPVAVAAYLYGPWWAAAVGVIADLIGASLFPSGIFFPGFTLTAAVGGLLYGFFFYKKELTLLNIGLAAAAHAVIVTLLMNTLWISMMTGSPFLAHLLTRIVQTLIMIPLQFVVLYALRGPVASLKRRLSL